MLCCITHSDKPGTPINGVLKNSLHKIEEEGQSLGGISLEIIEYFELSADLSRLDYMGSVRGGTAVFI